MGQAASTGSTSDYGKTTETGALGEARATSSSERSDKFTRTSERSGPQPQATGSAEPSSDKLATDLPASPTTETKYSGFDKLDAVSDNSAERAKPFETKTKVPLAATK